MDDEEEEMRIHFERLTLTMNSRNVTKTKPVGQKNRPTNINKDSYKQALRMSNMTPGELEVLRRENASSSDCTSQNAQSSKRKKKNKKKPDTDTIKLLADVSEHDKKQIATYLDKGSGANWKQLAQTFGLGAGNIRDLTDCYPQASHTEKLIEMLEENRPDLEMPEFIQKCKLIGRNDVPEYILMHILK